VTRARVCCLLALALGTGAGCRPRIRAERADGARLQVHWTGADTADFSASAVAERCDSLELLEIRATSGDTGIALALYRSGPVEPGDYPIRPPAQARATLPSAALALRFTARTSVLGFRGDSGKISLRRSAAGELFGSFRAGASAAAGRGRLTLDGSFEGLRVRPAARSCAGETAPVDSGGAGDTAEGRVD
jgi:hypothetical protein